jgi:hypothetical protein
MTMLGGVSDWQVQQWITALVAGENWGSLHFSDPMADEANASATEVPGATYQRAQLFFVADGTRGMFNSGTTTWLGLAPTTITHVGVFDSVVGGHLRCSIPLLAPYIVLPGKGYSAAAETLYWRWP